jgi:hypothetical protein
VLSFFKRKETVDADEAVCQLLRVIDACKLSAPNDVRPVSDPLFESIASAVKGKWTREHANNFKAQIKDGATCEEFVYNSVIKTVASRLQTGKHHLFLGVLDDEGKHYLDLFEHAIATLVLRGVYSKEWADETVRAPLLKAIKELG